MPGSSEGRLTCIWCRAPENSFTVALVKMSSPDIDPDARLGTFVQGVHGAVDRDQKVAHALEDAATEGAPVQDREPGLSQANAKLVYRTVLAFDDPGNVGYVVPLKLRKASNPLFRKARIV
jgi:hypothetical protein